MFSKAEPLKWLFKAHGLDPEGTGRETSTILALDPWIWAS
jgi:hypothetical protein